jgi:hypothetical protein
MKPSLIRFPQLYWQKASYCAAGECVEVATNRDAVLVRNSTKPRRVVRYSAEEWQAFLQGVKAGEFDLG